MHFQWQGLNTTVTRPVDGLWRLIVQRMLLSDLYTGKGDKCYNFMFFSHKLEMQLQNTRNFESVTVK